MSERARNWLIFGLEVALVVGYLPAFGVFVTQSEDFVVEQNRTSAVAAARARTAAEPAEFTFGPDQADNNLLGAGWYVPEEADEGAWTRSTLAYLYLPVTVDHAGQTIVLDGEAYLAPGHETVTITLTAEGTELGTWVAQHGQPAPLIEAAVPAAAATDGVLELQLNAAPLAVPYHYDNPDEKRNIGFLLRGVSISAAGNADLE